MLKSQIYTKHYYIESQRVATKLGRGMANNLINPISGTIDAIDGNVKRIATDLIENLIAYSCATTLSIEIEPQFPSIENYMQQDEEERDLPIAIGIYHSDHLGSSSWITNASGTVNQHLAYMPFAESFIDQRATSHDIRFKFTGKERDSETGFDYFGARYYSSDLSIWLSVDPMSDKLPFISPYSYCYNHPVNYKDADGKFPLLSGLIGGAIGVGVKYIHKEYIQKEEFTWKDAAVGFAGGFMVGSGAALIGAMGYSTTTAIMMNGVNGALSMGFENSMEAVFDNRQMDLSEFASDFSIGLITGMAGGAVTEGLSAFVNKIGDKTITQLTKKEYKQYLRGQTKQFKNQLRGRGLKASGMNFKKQLNNMLQNSKDVKISEIEGVRAAVTKTAQGTSQITLTELNLISDDKVK